jgi:VCBS repeat-containing protein
MVATRSPKAQRCVVEALEPKLLYSADITPMAFLPDASAALISTPSMATQQISSTLQPAGTEIVFIDTSVADSASLINDLNQQAQQGRALEIVLIEPKQDGITLITETLANRHDISAIHLVGHGVTGQAQLGSAALNTDNLLTRADEVASWAQALTLDADLLIYGCDVGASPNGQALVNGLAHLTGADVAASADNTGLKALGGNWQLEVTSGGGIEAQLAPSLDEQGSWDHLLGTPIAVSENTTYVGREPAHYVVNNVYSLDTTYQDSNKFKISSAGDVSFITAPNFEAPRDTNGDNTYMIKVVVTDGGLLSASTVYQIDVTDVDEAPVITSNGGGATALLNVAESYSNGGYLQYVTTINASDPEGSNVRYAISGGSDAGQFTLLFGNYLFFTWGPNYEAPTDTGADNQYQVTVQATDATSHTSSQTLYINVTNTNEAPWIISNGGGDTASTTVMENTKGVTTVKGTDPDANTTLYYAIVNGADQNLFDINTSTGVLTFKSAPDFEAPTDSNQNNIYEVYVNVSDRTYTKSQRLLVSVEDTNEPPAITSNGGGASATIAVFENTTAVTTVTATDLDAGATLQFSVSGADASKFVINSTSGELSFVSPPDYETAPHQYLITVQVSDEASNIDTQLLSINLNNVNEPPRITSNSGGPSATVFVAEGTTNVTSVVGADLDSPTLIYSIVGGADASAFNISSTGVLSLISPPYLTTPADSDGNNVYEVTVQVDDEVANRAVKVQQTILANVIHVNTPPTIQNESGAALAFTAINENQSLNISIVATDPDVGTNLSYAIVGGADAERFTINAQTGALEFVSRPDFEAPTDSDQNNVYELIVSASDGPESDTQQWTITVNNINDVPVAHDDGGYELNEDESLIIPLGPNSVLSNDTDEDNAQSTLTATLGQTTAHGSLSLAADGSFSYTPNANFNGSDSFTYTVSDGLAMSPPATVTITVRSVNDVPVANVDNAAINEDTELTGNVLTNDLDADGDLLTASIASSPAHGDLIFNVDGSYTYTPAANFFGVDSFSYTVDDGQGGVATGTVSMVVAPINDPPIGIDSTLVATEDTPVIGSVGNQASDADGDPLTFTLVNPTGHTTNGLVELNADGSFTYTPNANFNGQDQFTYFTSDGQSRSNDTTVTIDVASVNDVPVALDDTASSDEDTAMSGNVLSNDTDVDDPTLTMDLISGTSHGQLQWDASGHYTYAPDLNFNGVDSFIYKVSDASGSYTTATMTITINAVNDAPELNHSGSTQTYAENGAAIVIDATFSLADVDSPDLIGATVAISPDQFKAGEDVLTCANQNGILSSYDASTGVLTLTGSDSLASYQSALRSVTYTNSSDNPETTTRTVTFTVDDGGDVNNTGAVDQFVAVVAANDAPAISHSGPSLQFTENSPATVVDATINLSDLDNTNLVGATVAIAPAQFKAGEDVLAFSNQSGIQGTFDAGTGTLTLTGSASLANYQAALRSVTYANTSDTPDTTTRTVTFTVDDGEVNNHTGTLDQFIAVTAVNDAPVVERNALTISQGQSALPDLLITDADTPSSNILITTSFVTSGHFTNSNTGGNISSFTWADFQAGYIRFVQDNSSQKPGYRLEVSDGQSPPATSSVVVTFNPLYIAAPAPEVSSPTIDKKPGNTPPTSTDASSPNPAAEAPAQALGVVQQPLEPSGDGANMPMLAALLMDSGNLGNNGLSGLSPSASGTMARFAIDTNAPREWRVESTELNTDTVNGSYNWTGFLQSSEAPETLRRNLDTLRNQLMGQEVGRHQIIASTIAMSTGLSVGYVIWLVRGGALLGSMLSSMPMWQMIDPLPVLTRSAGSRRKESDEPADDASVEQIFDGEQHEPTPPPAPHVEAPQKLTPEATT